MKYTPEMDKHTAKIECSWDVLNWMWEQEWHTQQNLQMGNVNH